MKWLKSTFVLLLTVLLPAMPAQAGPAPEHALAKTRLWLALCDAAAGRGVTCPQNVRPEDVQWAIPADSLRADARLQLQSVHLDPFLHEIRFRLRFANQPSTPSFEAWCSLRADPVFLGASLARHSVAPRSATVSPQAALVSIRRPAILHLHSENSEATLRVRVLQSGELGDAVRVRVIGNGHTLMARVAGPDYLDAVF